MEGIKGERSEDQRDGNENRQQHGFDLEHCEVPKERSSIKNVSCLYLELWFSLQGAPHFQNFHKKYSESEKWSRKTLDGKCDGYMWVLGGANKRKRSTTF